MALVTMFLSFSCRIRMLSPTESIPARPARPTICLYWLLFRKSVAMYGERRITLCANRGQTEVRSFQQQQMCITFDMYT